jgi:di/tricarboxylate transporter
VELNAGMLTVLGILAVAIVLFISDRVRPDLVALGVLAALMAFGILTPNEALQGFSNTTVFIITALFIVGGAVFRTGLADRLGRMILRVGGASEIRLLLVLMVAVAVMSTVISSTGVVALMLPAIISLGARARISPSRLLIPVAFAALIGGSATLIGTPPNLIVSASLQDAGLAPFGFFSFTPLAALLLALVIGFVLLVGRRILPARTPATRKGGIDLQALTHYYDLDQTLFQLVVPEGSPLAGHTLAESRLRAVYGLSVLSVQHATPRPFTPGASSALATTDLEPGDVLVVQGSAAEVERLQRETAVEVRLDVPGEDNDDLRATVGMAEVMLRPRSAAIGKTLRELEFGSQYRLNVLLLRRAGSSEITDPSEVNLQFGDVLVVSGAWRDIFALGRLGSSDFIVLGQDEAEESGLGARLTHAPLVVGVLALMVLAVVINPDLLTLASLAAALAVVVGGALTMSEAYEAIDMKTVVLVAAMIPLSTAMTNVGLVDVLASLLQNTLGSVSPLAVLAGLFIMTSVMTQVLSNTVTTVLLAPLAISTAAAMGVAPQAFLMSIAVAASLAFATPIGSPVNTLVMTPGNYRFADFARIGIPLIGLGFVLALLVLPLLFPF